VDIDQHTLDLLQRSGLTPDSVPPAGETVYLKATANLSTGGTATDVTELVHSYNVFMAERISRIIDLDICGIDIMTTDITRPLNECGAVLEVNAAPGFRMHLDPTEALDATWPSPWWICSSRRVPPAVSPSSPLPVPTAKPPPRASSRTSCAATAAKWA
jgi:cyanophycin synthetase